MGDFGFGDHAGGFDVEANGSGKKKKKKKDKDGEFGAREFGGGLDAFEKSAHGGEGGTFGSSAFGGGIGGFSPGGSRRDERRVSFEGDRPEGSFSTNGFDSALSGGRGGSDYVAREYDRDRRDRDRDRYDFDRPRDPYDRDRDRDRYSSERGDRDRYNGDRGHYERERYFAAPPRDRFEESAFSSGREAFGDRDRDRGHSQDRSPRRTFSVPPPPSVLDSALERATAERRGDPYYSDGARRAELGLADFVDQRRNATRGHDFNSVAGLPERKFSFSLADLPDGAVRSPHYVGARPQRGLPPHAHAKWNPLEGIKRHWLGDRSEVPPVPAGYASQPSLPSTAPLLGGSPDIPSAPQLLLKPGSLEEELSRSEGRAQALRMKIQNLEADLVGGAARRGGENFVKIVVPHLPPNGRLGLTLKDTTITAFTDPHAQQFGWVVGDQIMAVNGSPVSTQLDFSGELQRVIAEHHATGRPMVFDVSRVLDPRHMQSALQPPVTAPPPHGVPLLHPAAPQPPYSVPQTTFVGGAPPYPYVVMGSAVGSPGPVRLPSPIRR